MSLSLSHTHTQHKYAQHPQRGGSTAEIDEIEAKIELLNLICQRRENRGGGSRKEVQQQSERR